MGRSIEDVTDRLDLMTGIAAIDGDNRHLLGCGNHRHINGASDALGRAMPGTGLDRVRARIREEVNIGAGDTRGIGRQDDGTIHLG